MNRTRRKIRGAVHGQQELVVQDPKRAQQTCIFKAIKDIKKDTIEMMRRDGIEQVRSVIAVSALQDQAGE